MQIDPEFQRLCRPLSEQELEKLRTSLKDEGQRDLIVAWKGLILDGHNRHRLCAELGLTPRYREAPDTVETREDAMAWIIQNQLARRNLTPSEMSELRGRLYELEKVRDRSEAVAKGHLARSDRRQNGGDQEKMRNATAKRLAAQHGVGVRTIQHDAAFAKGLDAIAGAVGEHAAEEIRRGSGKLSKGTVEEIGRKKKPEVKAAYQAALRKSQGKDKAAVSREVREKLMEQVRPVKPEDSHRYLRWRAFQSTADRFGMAASEDDAEEFAKWAMENADNRRFLETMKGRLLWMSKFINTVQTEMWQRTEQSE